MDIGTQIKELRKAKKMTQVELSAHAEISRSYLADVEAGRYNPSLETLSKLAQALSVEVSALFKGNAVQPDSPAASPENTGSATRDNGVRTVAAHKTDGYEDELTEDEKIAVRAFLETYRKQKQMVKEKKGD
ncbi:MAG: hypothetical protein APF77_04105 [Clostridia bacterium BRH_c25]|nr:MAG: hypothetical protein APF77_04105 [Clostridia bacterium BRH_c25]